MQKEQLAPFCFLTKKLFLKEHFLFSKEKSRAPKGVEAKTDRVTHL